MRELTFAEAIREALIEEMERDERVIIMGEDIALYGGAFKVTREFVDLFGPERVINTPISEGGFTGVAIGAALLGSRPVVEIMFMDFIMQAMDQLVNQGGKFHWVYGDQAEVPMVVRTPGGGGRSYGPTHSQSLEVHFVRTPGIKVVAPANPSDAKGLLKTAVRDPNPVIFLESKVLYPQKGPVPEGEHLVPFGKAAVPRSGSDVTLVAYSRMTNEALLAAQHLAEQGIDAEVIDLRSLMPLDSETVLESVRRTGRVVLVEEGNRTCGMCAEIGFQIGEQVYDYLEAPLRRVTTPDIPVPCGAALEAAALPSAEKIVQVVQELAEAY